MLIPILSNFLALPLFPVGFVFFCLIAGLVALLLRKRILAFAFVFIATATLYAFSTDPLSYTLVRSLEERFAPVQTFPPATTIVLLTGGEVPRMPPRLYDEVNEAGDRVMYAARLFHQGASPRILVTGGHLAFYRSIEGSEAEASSRLLTGLFGIDSSRILLETKSRNTYENGLYTRQLLDSLRLPLKIILVTSAMHMPRSVAVFKQLGYDVYPAPTDFRADVPHRVKLISLLPTIGALENSTTALHEWYGLLAYKLMGRG